MEKTSIYRSDKERLLPVPKTELSGDSLRPPNRDYQEKENEALITKKGLPADHLTATYWG